jgi:uncharacterized membrane protein YfhO
MVKPRQLNFIKSAAVYHWPILVFLIILVIYFFRLFYPVPGIYFTPDFGHSDIVSFNYPLKDFLHQSLQHHQLPFWNKNMGTGFPVFAEGQVGALYPQNLILFALLPTWLAWNLLFPITLLITFLGVYYFCLHFHLSNHASFLAGFSYSFGSYIIFQFTHPNVIETISLIPWIFLFGQKLFDKPNKKNLLLLTLLISLQFYASFLQASFITLIGLIVFFGCQTYLHRKSFTQVVTLFFVAFFLAALISAPQLLPTYELKQLSQLKTGSQEVFKYPLPVKHLISFLLPNYFGLPQLGTYPKYNENWGIFWENTHYIGFLIILLIVIGLTLNFKRYFKSTVMIPLFFLGIISVLLALSSATPFKLFFYLPGFNLFRVPARFLILTSFSLSMLAGISFDALKTIIHKHYSRYSVLLILFIFFSAVDLLRLNWNYHPIIKLHTFLEPPLSLQLIPKDHRIYSFLSNQILAWNQVFDHEGWKDTSPFIYFKNGLDPNSNLIWNTPSVTEYSAMRPLREDLYKNILNSSLLNAAAGEYVISPDSLITLPQLVEIQTITPSLSSLPTYHIYYNTTSLKRFRFASTYIVKSTQDQVLQTLYQQSFPFETTAILETDPRQAFEQLTTANITVNIDSHQFLKLTTHTDKPALLIVADSYYPEWHGYIDGKETTINPANLNQRAIIIPAGIHTITFRYIPTKFYQGLLLALTGLICLILFYKSRLIQEKLFLTN